MWNKADLRASLDASERAIMQNKANWPGLPAQTSADPPLCETKPICGEGWARADGRIMRNKANIGAGSSPSIWGERGCSPYSAKQSQFRGSGQQEAAGSEPQGRWGKQSQLAAVLMNGNCWLERRLWQEARLCGCEKQSQFRPAGQMVSTAHPTREPRAGVRNKANPRGRPASTGLTSFAKQSQFAGRADHLWDGGETLSLPRRYRWWPSSTGRGKASLGVPVGAADGRSVRDSSCGVPAFTNRAVAKTRAPEM